METRRLVEGSCDLQADVDPAALGLSGTEFTFPGNVTGDVRFSRAGKRILARGKLNAPAAAGCVRCLQPAKFTLGVPVRATIGCMKRI